MDGDDGSSNPISYGKLINPFCLFVFEFLIHFFVYLVVFIFLFMLFRFNLFILFAFVNTIKSINTCKTTLQMYDQWCIEKN
jgi:hypothetical protein